MPRPSVRRVVAAALLVLGSVPVVFAQPAAPPAPGRVVAAPAPVAPVVIDGRNADELRNELRELMRQYPPALGRVFRLDPALMSNPGYLATYPALAAFFQAHPEVPRYPDFFLNFVGENGWEAPLDAQSQIRRDALNYQYRIFEGIQIFVMISGGAFAVLWVLRLFIGHRRWLRVTRMQSDLNNRLFERLGSNEQLLTYLQSQPGQQLMATPIVGEAVTPTAAPFSRILWAVQAGIVLTSAGLGLLVIRGYVVAEAGEMLMTMGVLAMSLGIGFALAALASYVLSKRLGLLDVARDRAGESGRV
jgi:hypothetical protein